jgi:hypothetical protein
MGLERRTTGGFHRRALLSAIFTPATKVAWAGSRVRACVRAKTSEAPEILLTTHTTDGRLLAMNLFTEESWEAASFTFAKADGGPPIKQTVLGWVQGGCNITWSNVLPEILCSRYGPEICGGKTVLELGAGCGLIGLVAANWAMRVDITDGDEEEVELIRRNVEENAPTGGCVCSAVHLEWGGESAAAARKAGSPLSPDGYDLILASQVVYVPAAIEPLVMTIATMLRDDSSEALLYNDAVSTTSTQQECRALLDAAIAAHGLVAEPALCDGADQPTEGRLRLPEGTVMPHADSYVLRIRRRARGPSG